MIFQFTPEAVLFEFQCNEEEAIGVVAPTEVGHQYWMRMFSFLHREW